MHAKTQSVLPLADAVIVGAGMSGLYMLHRLRQAGFSAIVLEAADDVGGTWYWNRYPGARCDIQSLDYQFSFDPSLEDDWQWSEKYATQPEILRYLRRVADRYELRKDIQFSTRVHSASWDENNDCWNITTDKGDSVNSRFFIMATGCLSMPKQPDIPGADKFKGDAYVTGRWPHADIDFTGKRVAVIGTGSSGIQSIPIIAQQARQLTVFQRTPSYSMPAGNGPIPEKKRAAIAADRDAYREAARLSGGGVPVEMVMESALSVSEQERQGRYENAWAQGELFAPVEAFNDLLLNAASNDTFAEFIRQKIRATVNDPHTAELLCPTTYPMGTKRPCLDSGYYETFNLPHVHLVDLRTTPITTITENGIIFGEEYVEFDVIVFATGFDAMTGALTAIDIRGHNDLTLKEKWQHGPLTYLGLTTVGFPNLFMITAPGSPSVLSNMVVSIEQHVDWITDCIMHMRANDYTQIEATQTAENGWIQHVNDCADITLYPQANSWYIGANVPGKPRVFLPYAGGVGTYRETCDKVVANNYMGFHLSGPGGEQCNDGVVNRLQPDIAILLKTVAQMNLTPMETLPVDAARAMSKAISEQNPPGPEVGEIISGTLPGAVDELNYRLYRPTTKGPHPLVCYFHGGGWVLGAEDSDDAFCRDLCNRADVLIVSVNYRHAPEARFPAAADDAYTATCWLAKHANELSAKDDSVILAGWSAGGNLAAVTCQRIRDYGGPVVAGQLLIAPVTDNDFSRASYRENGDGYILTKGLMQWFWDHYADREDRDNPIASPLKATSLANLPAAAIFACEFDPLRDEGIAYANALKAAGNEVQLEICRGHIHTSPLAVDVILSSAPLRAEMAAALKRFTSL